MVSEPGCGRTAPGGDIVDMTRRGLLRASGVGALGGAGAVVLAACGETQVVTKEVPVETTVIKEVPVERIVTQTQIKEVPVERIVIKEVPVEKIVTKEVPVEKIVIQEKIVTVEKIVEVEAQRPPVVLTFATDHTSGPRGAAVKWAVEAFAQKRPDIRVLVEPVGGDYWDTLSIRAAAGTLPEMVLWDGHLFNAWRGADVVLKLNDVLAKMEGWNEEEYYYIPNLWTDNGHEDDHTFPPPTKLWGNQYGITYQGGINGFIYNETLVDQVGAGHPDESWTWDTLLENARKTTDPEAGTWGLDAGGNWFSWHPLIWSGNEEFFRSPDDTRFTMYDNGGTDGITFIHDAVFEEKVAASITESKEIRGEFSTPFTAGLQAYYFTERVRQTARPVAQIKDRFQWSLAPVPVNPATGKSGTFWSCQFSRRDQRRRGARKRRRDRGRVPVLWDGRAASSGWDRPRPLADVAARARDGGGARRAHRTAWSGSSGTADGTENRHRQYRMPNWVEWWQSWNGIEQKYMLGEATLDQTIQDVTRAAENNQASQIEEMRSRGWI